MIHTVFCLHPSIKCTILDTESFRYFGCCVLFVTLHFKPLSAYVKQHGFSVRPCCIHLYIGDRTTDLKARGYIYTVTPAHEKVLSHSAHCMNIVKYSYNVTLCVTNSHCVCVCTKICGVCLDIWRVSVIFITQPQFPTQMPSGNLHGLFPNLLSDRRSN